MEFNIDMKLSRISNYKSLLLRSRRKRRGRKPPAAVVAELAAPARRAGQAVGNSLDDVRTVKELAKRIGTDRLRELAALLSR
jgi:hypothetical protein